MNAKDMIESLERNGRAILALYEGLAAEQARWKPAPEKWSLLEILNHLCDEERDDFRLRIELTLGDPEAEWPLWDPEALVTEKAYNERDLAESLELTGESLDLGGQLIEHSLSLKDVEHSERGGAAQGVPRVGVSMEEGPPRLRHVVQERPE